MTPEQSRPIVPTQRDVDAWKLSAQQVISFGGVKLGEFNWPQAILSLAAEWEKNSEHAVFGKREASAPCSHCGKPATFLGPCGRGGCPLGADL